MEESDDRQEGRQVLADARRFTILERALKSGKATVDELLGEENFKNRFKASCSRRSLEGDFQELSKLFGKSVELTASGEEVRILSANAFAHLGYGLKEPRKCAIARLIVDKFLTKKNKVAYLSTGTSVFEVATVLLEKVEEGNCELTDIVTDNLAIVDLFCNRARHSPHVRNITLTILGGEADFGQGDVSLGDTSQLQEWEFSTAVVSATKINPTTGKISSSRQPRTKRKFFETGVVGQLIIPVTSDKISSKAGGKVIFDPRSGNEQEDKKKVIIVTESMDEDVKARLQPWYDVHVADAEKAKTPKAEKGLATEKDIVVKLEKDVKAEKDI